MNNINNWLKKSQPCLAYTDFVAEVNQLDFSGFEKEELKAAISCFRKTDPYTLNEQVKLFAILKEVIDRLTGLTLFDSQLASSASLLQGRIVELPTGEGKTLAAVIPAVAHALQGLSVHILTFNDYLAERDYDTTRSIYKFCGLSAGFVTQSMKKSERIRMYQRDIVYITAKEAGFDYLKNFLRTETDELIPIRFQFAIIDEADSIMIDEAKNPLVIACDYPRDFELINNISRIICGLKPYDVTVSKTENQAYLTEQGIKEIEASLAVENLYEERNVDILSMVNIALQAQYLLKQDVDYVITDRKVRIIDETTGRAAGNRKYPDLLHACVEAKEGLPLSRSSMIYNMMTIQNFLLQYKKLSGMTGTAVTSKNEFYQVYGLEVDVISPHIPSRRVDHEALLFPLKTEKYKAVINTVLTAYRKGQPVLIGTQSVEESELISGMLADYRIPHNILNAKNDKEEAALIAEAGKPYAVTVSTNMAGRGVDIKLGGADVSKKKEAQSAGGLLVIGIGLNRSIRIDHQLCGRAGRQGDPGESRFFVSAEDDLFEGIDWAPKTTGKQIRRIQQHIEGIDEESRMVLSKYAYILEQQRQIITDYRNPFLMTGEIGVQRAVKQLTLYYTSLRWAQYLEYMEYVRDGIHLTIIGGLNPIEEYHKFAIQAFVEIMEEIKTDVHHGMQTYEITENGIDMEAAGLGNATSTWTYLIDESSSQFSALPRLINGISNQMKGTLFSLSSIFKTLCKWRVRLRFKSLK